jgi:hypothetical protein
LGNNKLVLYSLLLLAIMLCGCSSAKAITSPDLIWKVEVFKVELKKNLNAVEAVTQYNGSSTNVEHHQSPANGNIYLIFKSKISKSGTGSIAFDWKKLVIRDESGAVYQRHPNDTFLEQYNYTPRMTGLEIRLGSNEGWVCYEIPAKATGGKLILAYTAGGSQQEIILPK